MLKKSILTEYCYDLAKEHGEAYAKKGITVDLFALACAKLLISFKEGKLPERIESKGCREELAEVEQIFARYKLDAGSAVESITRALASKSGVSNFIEMFGFNTLVENVNKFAEMSHEEELALPTYALLILQNPTDAIKEAIENSKEPANPLDGDTPAADSEDERAKIAATVARFRAAADRFLRDEQRKDESSGGSEDEPKSDESEDEPKGEESEISEDSLQRALAETQSVRSALLENVFGQDGAINTFSTGYFRSRVMAGSRTKSKRPAATFLFAGPPGVGKTYLSETFAEALGLPFKRFDMSEYSDGQQSVNEFTGNDGSYKNAKPGNVTGFVMENPKCVLLFDEIEKAHLSVIYLFLQILDAGRLRDSYCDKEVSFTDTIIIFTTNAGKTLYEGNDSTSLSSIPKKTIIKALSEDLHPTTKEPIFPAAILSRFAAGNVVMFNHLAANHLYTITKRELEKNVELVSGQSKVKVDFDDRVASAILLAEGGNADARTVCGRANSFFHEELFELLRLVNQGNNDALAQLRRVKVSLDMENIPKGVAELLENTKTPEVLIFASPEKAELCKQKITNAVCYTANTIAKAKDILFKRDISVVLCDIFYSPKGAAKDMLNAEDISSVGRDFLSYMLDSSDKATYVLVDSKDIISKEEYLSFTRLGVRDIIVLVGGLEERVALECDIAYRQESMRKLARENRVLCYKTYQSVSEDGQTAEIKLYGLTLKISAASTDAKYILDGVSKPNIRFSDVIGAKDAKDELGYFVEYLKNPVKYLRMGVRAPRGVLLYGPPGTGKTMLAKAVAGESDVTFIVAEGNQFIDCHPGEGAKKVHDIFATARRFAPSILFIDEIDSIAKDRMLTGGSATANDVINALLTELDGFKSDTSRPVFLLAATNFGVEAGGECALDAALMRRFDRRIYVDLPTKDERRQYIDMKVKANRIITLSDEQIESIAERAVGMSLASLESVIELAMRNAIRSKAGKVGDAEFDEAFETFGFGEKREWDKKELTRTARHEAGHALLSWLSGDKPTYLTVVSRGNHGGYMQHGDNEGKGVYTKEELLARIRTSLGGRAAELVYYGDKDGVSTGPSADIYGATATAERMLCVYGMYNEFGISHVDSKGRGAEELIRAKVNEILFGELERAKEIIKKHRVAIDALVEALVDKNQLRGVEIDAILSENAVK